MAGKKKKKEPKRKPKYGLFASVGYIYRLLWNTERSLVFTGIVLVPLSVILAALALYTPSAVLRALETADRFSFIALTIVGLLLARLLFHLCDNMIQVKVGNAEHMVLMQMIYMYQKKRREQDWYLDYDPEFQKLDKRGYAAITNNHTAGVHFPMEFSDILGMLLKFILFGSVISMLNPLILLLLAGGCAVNYAMSAWERKKNWSDRDIRNKIDEKIGYTAVNLSLDNQYAKEIRLYGMQDGMHMRFLELLRQGLREKKKLEWRNFLVTLVEFLIFLLRDGIAYVFLIYQAAAGKLDAAACVLYFSAISQMSGLMGNILWKVSRVSEGALQVSDFREALEVEGRLNRGKGIPVPKGPFSIEFRNVSFTYPEGEKKVLDNISFQIEAGEKIALVGLNGAGKTTLTMMMCGLLLPDEGEVLLDGHTLYEYNREELYGLFGLVSQRFSLLPLSIAKNVACTMEDENIDRARLAHCIELSGLTEKIASLPKGADTPLNRELNRDGTELSGGETQKVLLARLLYKNPSCIILDEPTAALDPIAEDKIYRRYREIASHATSVFISHRLASTRFCDRIFLLDGAQFAESGTHEELMAAGEKYKELFEVQSKYYKEGGKDDETEKE